MGSITNIEEHIILFRSLFNGRNDVFAKRWEKGNKNGYMPAYFYDPYRYKAHQMRGGSFKDFKEKKYLELKDEQILKHLKGERLIGIYPLLKDNTSWFIVADFDKSGWKKECKDFITICHKQNIPVYLERSQSGNGGHIWIFFERPYPAIKSRTIFKSLLEESGSFSIFDKTASFDRLFPNQDYLSGKGLGNLIALPLHEPNVEKGNSCFINPDTFEPYDDQWIFLRQIQRIKTDQLDNLYNSIQQEVIPSTSSTNNGKLIIALDRSIRINRTGLTLSLINFLKSTYNLPNSEYFIKKKMNRNTWNTDKYFNLIRETDTEIILPRGAIGKLIRFCRQQKIEFDFQDNRKKEEAINFEFNASLLKHQQEITASIEKKDYGVVVAPPGSGKTIIGLKIIADKQQSALIIVHRKQLLDQWIERIENFLKVPKTEIGKIGNGKVKIGKKITIAMIQSLAKRIDDNDISKIFKTIIIDECHHIPAASYINTVSKLFPYYQYGLTATPFRKYNDGKLIFAYLGDPIIEIKSKDIETFKRAQVVIRNTSLNVPFNSKTDVFETLSKILIHDSIRNKLILTDICRETDNGKKVVVITERKEHIIALYQFLKQTYEVITLNGEDSESDRNLKWKSLKEGNYQILITTGQFFGEGTDLKNATCLFLVYPFSFKGKLIQYIGRVQRSEITPIIYDYRDHKIEYLDRLFLKRNTYYRNLYKQATLFDDPLESTKVSQKGSIINKLIRVSIDQLDFRYGTIAFKYKDGSFSDEFEFEIENNYIRPEFDVLKPYFSKIIGSKKVEVHIHAEIENNTLISQLATSNDLEAINREIIETVRFTFIEKTLFGNKSSEIQNLTKEKNQESNAGLYQSTEELLEDILKNKSVKHYQQLQYLAANHMNTILKLRYVLNPFSFVFLLSGENQFHLILETLDTEEATYVWHIEKDTDTLKDNLEKVNKELNIIKNEGRQIYLESQPVNFNRIIHDYSNDKKGFILWRDQLEEKLF